MILISRISLVQKALLASILLGFLLWLGLDYFQQKQLDKLLDNERSNTLQQDSETAQARFYSAVGDHVKIINLFAKQKTVIDFLSVVDRPAGLHIEHSEWVPQRSSWRGLVLPTAFILHDKNKELITSYQLDQDIPASLTKNLRKGLDSPALEPQVILLDGVPSLLVFQEVNHNVLGTLGFISMFARLDDQFLYGRLAYNLSADAIVALFDTSTEKPAVLSSSDLVRVPVGVKQSDLRKAYLFGGKGTFDQGDWGADIKLYVLTSRDSKAELAIDIKQLDHKQRLYGVSFIVASFILLMLVFSRRIRKVSKRIQTFAHEELEVVLDDRKSPDAVDSLEDCFNQLSVEVLNSRAALVEQYEVQRRVDHLNILETVTDDLGVGVLEQDKQGDWVVLNNPMHDYIKEIGDVDSFVTANDSVDVTAVDGKRRVFTISNLDAEQRKLILVNEVTELREKTEELTQMALYDGLTGLTNRALFNDRLSQLIESSKRDSNRFGLLVMDLDRFKEVNDTLGHSMGDLLLKEVAHRFNQNIRGSDTFARIGGDEFAVLLPHADSFKANFVAAKLVDAQRVAYQIGSHTMDVGVSIGVVIFPSDGDTSELLLSRADVAMYHAKRNKLGRSGYKFDLDSSSSDRLKLVADLRVAIQKEMLTLHYQPQLDVVSKKISGWEALVRWHHPERGWIPPDVFIPIAEEMGLIQDITKLVLAQAISDCHQWQMEGQFGGVSINLSAHDLSNQRLPNTMNQQLLATGLLASQVTLEVTESALMRNPDKAKQVLDALHELGVLLSIDDFGTGYSSLSYLKNLSMDEVKIDQSFVKNLVDDKGDRAIVDAVIGLSKSLGMSVVAEGVEDAVVLTELERLGCTIAQGYYFAKSMPFAEMVIFNLNHLDFKKLETLA